MILMLTVVYAVLIAFETRRPLWYDELLTFLIARTPELTKLFALVKRWDLNPPLVHLLAHASLWLTGGNASAVRFPSIVEFYAASLLLFWYAFRKLGSASAALPVLVLWYSPMFRYAVEARPYALLCLFFCALLLLWDAAIATSARGFTLAGIALSSIALVSSHLVAPLSLLPFLVAEAVRAFVRRKADYPLWAALFLPLGLTVFYIPIYRSYRTIVYYPPAFQASLLKAASFYWHTLSQALLFLFLTAFAGWILSRTKRLRISSLPWRSFDYALFATAALIPLLLDIALMLDRAPFWGRYAITSALALYLFGGINVAALFRGKPRAGYVSVAAGFVLLLVIRILIPWQAAVKHPAPRSFASLAQVKPDLPIVAASGLTFVEMGQQEDPRVLKRLFYLRDRSAAIQFAHATIFEDFAEFRRTFQLPGVVEPYRGFTREHNDFLVFGTFDYPEDWLLRKLAADGATIKLLGTYKTPYKDKTLYEVRLAGEPPKPAGPL